MLMAQPTTREAKDIQQVLSNFIEAPVTTINLSKYQNFFFNTTFAIHVHISRILSVQQSSLPSKYLGTPLIDNGLCNSSWEYLLSKMNHKPTKWSFRLLNTLGCFFLLKFVLQAMSLYFSPLLQPQNIF
jgi:hypothetical protein